MRGAGGHFLDGLREVGDLPGNAFVLRQDGQREGEAAHELGRRVRGVLTAPFCVQTASARRSEVRGGTVISAASLTLLSTRPRVKSSLHPQLQTPPLSSRARVCMPPATTCRHRHPHQIYRMAIIRTEYPKPSLEGEEGGSPSRCSFGRRDSGAPAR